MNKLTKTIMFTTKVLILTIDYVVYNDHGSDCKFCALMVP